MGTKKRTKYTDDFKREAVRQLEERGRRTAEEVGVSVGVAPALLYKWRRQYQEVVAEVRAERGESPEEEVKRLRAEVAKLRRQKEILKKAAAFFAQESEQ